jgi:hypothetical protein
MAGLLFPATLPATPVGQPGGAGAAAFHIGTVTLGTPLWMAVSGFAGTLDAGDVKDNVNNAVSGDWGAPIAYGTNPGTSDRVAIFVKLNSAAGDVTATCNPASTTFHTVLAGAVDGLGANTVVQTLTNTYGFGAQAACTSQTPTNQNSFSLIAGTHAAGNPTFDKPTSTRYVKVGEQRDYGGAVQPLYVFFLDQPETIAVAMAVDFDASVTWTAVQVIFSEPPQAGVATKVFDDAQTATLSLGATVPTIGQQLTVFLSNYRRDSLTTDWTSNNTDTFTRDVLLSVSGGDPEDGIPALFSAIVDSNSTTPYVVTWDGGITTPMAFGRWGTAALFAHDVGARPNLSASDTDLGTTASQIPETGGNLQVTTPSGSWIAFLCGSTRGHVDQCKLHKPSSSWVWMVNNPEHSLHTAGFCMYLLGSGAGTLAPTITITNPTSGASEETTEYRAILAVYSVAGGVTPSILRQMMQHFQ